MPVRDSTNGRSVTLPRRYAGAEALYAAASRAAPDASRVVFFVRATVDLACTRDAFAERVTEAARVLQARHELLGAALGPHGFVPSDAPLPCEVVIADAPHRAVLSQLEAEWRMPAESSLFRLRVVLPRDAQGERIHGPMPLSLLVRGHHAACDAVSLAGLAAEFLRALCDPTSLPRETSDASPPDLLTVSRRELGSPWRRPALVARAAFAYLRGGRDVPGPVVQLAPAESTSTAPLRCVEVSLAPLDTERLRRRCREHGVGFSALLLAAAALACESPGRVDLGVALDLRRRAKATALPASALGFFVAMTDVALRVTRDTEPWALAARAAAVLKDREEDAPEQAFATALAVAPLVPVVARHVAAGRSVFPQTLLFSNVGECSALFDGMPGSEVASAGFAASPRGSRKLHVSCTSVRGALSVCLAWPEGTLTAARVDRFAAALRRVLLTA